MLHVFWDGGFQLRIVLLGHAWLPISITNVQHQATCPEQIFSIEEHHLQ